MRGAEYKPVAVKALRTVCVMLAVMLLIAASATATAVHAGAPAPAPYGQSEPSAAPVSSTSLENDVLRLDIDDTDLNIRLTDKRTGYVWSCNAQPDDPDLNDTWRRFGSSGITINCSVNGISEQQVSFAEFDPARVTKRGGGLAADISFPKQGISFTVTYRLDSDSLLVGIPFDSIKQTNEKFSLQSITICPFLGASRGQADGFILVPDGSGALIDLSQPTRATQPYKALVYGDDLGFYGISNLQKTGGLPLARAALPAYGIAYGENALMTVITGGAPYGTISAYASGVTMNYNWAATTFTYRDFYYQFTTASQNFSAGVLANQAEPNRFDAELRFMALSGDHASYAGMATRARSLLIAEGVLAPVGQAHNSSVRLQMLMADSKEWLLGRSVITMTRPEDALAIVDGLASQGVSGISVELTGYQRSGATNAPPVTGDFPGGGRWDRLVSGLRASGVPLYLYSDFVRVYNGAGGYGKADIAFTISDRLVSMNNPQSIFRSISGNRDYSAFYFLNPSATARLMPQGVTALQKRGVTGISMDALGTWLNSAYKNTPYTRSAVIEAYTALLDQSGEMDFAFYNPNSYVWKYASAVYDLPMGGSGLLIETESVPFLPIVLRGSADYFATPSNFWADPSKELLKLVEYGALPSYILTWEDPVKLIGTDSAWIYSSRYDVWRDRIQQQYNFLRPALDAARGAEITGHQELQPGIYRTDYSNGTSVLVNYNRVDSTVDGRSVPSMGYTLMGEAGK